MATKAKPVAAKTVELDVNAEASGQVIGLPDGRARIIINTAVTVDGEFLGYGVFDQIYDPTEQLKKKAENRAQRRAKR